MYKSSSGKQWKVRIKWHRYTGKLIEESDGRNRITRPREMIAGLIVPRTGEQDNSMGPR